MIYRTKFFREELSYGYFERKKSLGALLALGVFLGMLTFSVYFIFQTLTQSVLSDEASFLVQRSYHTTSLLYLSVSYGAFWIYITARFQMVTFSEVYENTWYGLVHQGYSIVPLVFGKLFAQLFGVLLINTAGFVTTLVMSSFLKFPFIPGYLVSMFLIGTFNCTSLLIFAMAASLLIRDIGNARSLFSVGAFLLVVLQIVFGFFTLITNRVSIQHVSALFTESAYLYVDIGLLLLCVFLCILKGSQAARLFHEPLLSEPPALDRTTRDASRRAHRIRGACHPAKREAAFRELPAEEARQSAFVHHVVRARDRRSGDVCHRPCHACVFLCFAGEGNVHHGLYSLYFPILHHGAGGQVQRHRLF